MAACETGVRGCCLMSCTQTEQTVLGGWPGVTFQEGQAQDGGGADDHGGTGDEGNARPDPHLCNKNIVIVMSHC